MRGYFRNAELTAQAIDADGWLNTGDLARQEADGALFIVGRTKELIIRSGFNVHPAEVEGVRNAQAAVTHSWRCSAASRPRAAPSCWSSRTRNAPWTLPTTCYLMQGGRVVLAQPAADVDLARLHQLYFARPS
jgi:non-ribosomal peptide synthetase component F